MTDASIASAPEGTSTLHRRAQRSLPADGVIHDIDPESAGWSYVSFIDRRLEPGAGFVRPADDREVAIVVMEGSVDIASDGQRWASVGSRDSVFDGPPAPLLLAGPGATVEVVASTAAEVVIVASPSPDVTRTRLIEADDIIVERRGSDDTERHIHHLLPPSAEAERLILFEVYTPGGNWSSYPPHKHDTEDPPTEAYLEELYYFRFARPEGWAFHRVYTPDRSLDASFAPRDRDVVLVPRGYHPVGQPAGYDGYYFNAMAGHHRAWHFTIDPEHAWLMDWDPDAPK